MKTWDESLQSAPWMNKKLILFMGKGGVGKSFLSNKVARLLAAQNKKVLLCHVLQVVEKKQRLSQPDATAYPTLWKITLHPFDCFEEYVHLKLPVKMLAELLVGNRVIQYFEKVAPGVRELVLLGKLWYEQRNYDHIIVDMPSTGYALTMLNTPFSYSSLIPSGAIFSDAREMIATLSNATTTAFVGIALAEEMPVQETLDLSEKLKKMMPSNPMHLIVNRLIKPSAALLNFKGKPHSKAISHVQGLYQKQLENLEKLKTQWTAGYWIELEEKHGPL